MHNNHLPSFFSLYFAVKIESIRIWYKVACIWKRSGSFMHTTSIFQPYYTVYIMPSLIPFSDNARRNTPFHPCTQLYEWVSRTSYRVHQVIFCSAEKHTRRDFRKDPAPYHARHLRTFSGSSSEPNHKVYEKPLHPLLSAYIWDRCLHPTKCPAVPHSQGRESSVL